MQLTTWLLAREDEAESIASSVTAGARPLNTWRHLSLPLVEMEFMALSAALRGTSDVAAESTLEGPPLVEAEALLVARVRGALLQSLAQVTDKERSTVVAAWVKLLATAAHEPVRLSELLSEMTGFAREAAARQSPVLALITF